MAYIITLVAGFHTAYRCEQVLVGGLQVPWNMPGTFLPLRTY